MTSSPDHDAESPMSQNTNPAEQKAPEAGQADLSSSPTNEASDSETSFASPPPKESPKATHKLWFVIAAVALILIAWPWWQNRSRINSIQANVADSLNIQMQTLATTQSELQQAKQTLQQATAQLQALEAQAAEAKGQQQALQMLYQEIARTRDDNVLLEVERAVTAASQHLQLSGNVQGALNALEAAENRLASVNRSDWSQLRQAIGRDIAQLKNLPFIDVKGINRRLEQILDSIDRLPLKAQALLHEPKATQDPASDSPQPGWGKRFFSEAWQEVKSMVRIERFDRGDPPLLIPEQVYFLRQNLRLRLLDARLALFTHDYETFRNDLLTAHDWLQRYFDEHDAEVSAALTQTKELSAARLDYESPTLRDSLSALSTAVSAHAPSVDSSLGTSKKGSR